MSRQENPLVIDTVLVITIIIVFILALTSCKPRPAAQHPVQRFEDPLPLLCTNFDIDAGVLAACNTFHVTDSRPCAICRQEHDCLFMRAMVWCVASCADSACLTMPADK